MHEVINEVTIVIGNEALFKYHSIPVKVIPKDFSRVYRIRSIRRHSRIEAAPPDALKGIVAALE